jgi:phosphoethanolamine N-methyltransferase
MAKRFGVQVYGYDLSVNMINIANDLRMEQKANVKHAVQFYVEDATLMDYPDQFYDMVYSRDTILHIKDKKALFEMFYRTLKPGGKVVITDYCHGDKPQHSQHFVDYVKSRGYHLHTVKEYGKILESAGFVDVEATNMTPGFIDILKGEVYDFRQKEHAIIDEFSQKEFDYIVDGWTAKIKRCSAGDQAWGYFVAKKPYAT